MVLGHGGFPGSRGSCDGVAQRRGFVANWTHLRTLVPVRGGDGMLWRCGPDVRHPGLGSSPRRGGSASIAFEEASVTEELFDLSSEYESMLNQGIRLSGESMAFFLEGRLAL